MEVILKRSKITSSIMSQCRMANTEHIYDYEALGWCIHKGISWIVLFSPAQRDISKFPFIKSTEIIPDQIHSNRSKIIVYFADEHLKPAHFITVGDETEALHTALSRIRTLALTRGQFFI